MKISACSFGFAMYPVEKTIEIVANLGFEAIDFQGTRPHLFYPQDYTKNEVKEIAELAESYGLKVVVIAASDGTPLCTLTHTNARVRRWMIDHLKASAEMAAIFGAKVVMTDTGYSCPIGTSKMKAWQWAKEGLKEAAETCSDYGVTVGLEAGPGTLVHDSRDNIRMIEEVNSDGLRALLDVGHEMVTFYNSWRENGPHPVDAIYNLKSYLIHVHINDNSGLADEHLVPGNGVIDFEAIINALYGIKYDGYLALEPLVRDPIKAFKDSKRYISKFFK